MEQKRVAKKEPQNFNIAITAIVAMVIILAIVLILAGNGTITGKATNVGDEGVLYVDGKTGNVKIAGGDLQLDNSKQIMFVDKAKTDGNKGRIYLDINDDLVLLTSGSDINLMPGGNVGIGTTEPTEKLDVVGNIKADSLILKGISPEGVAENYFACIDNNGKVFASPTPCDQLSIEEKCTDSDGGLDYYVKGTTSGLFNGEIETTSDACDSNIALDEFYCDGGNLQDDFYICPNGCKDGACIPAEEWDLSKYPAPFVQDGLLDDDAFIIVGDNASASDTIAASDIVTSLQFAGNNQTQVIQLGWPKAFLASEVSLKESAGSNLISIGDACVNSYIQSLLSPQNCNLNLEQGQALIAGTLITSTQYSPVPESGVKIFVAGYSDEDTRRAAKVLANYKDYKLAGNLVCVTGTSDKPVVTIGECPKEEVALPPTKEAIGCANYCGGQSPNGCWCDNLCTGYGDCCPDYKQYCATEENSIG